MTPEEIQKLKLEKEKLELEKEKLELESSTKSSNTPIFQDTQGATGYAGDAFQALVKSLDVADAPTRMGLADIIGQATGAGRVTKEGDYSKISPLVKESTPGPFDLAEELYKKGAFGDTSKYDSTPRIQFPTGGMSINPAKAARDITGVGLTVAQPSLLATGALSAAKKPIGALVRSGIFQNIAPRGTKTIAKLADYLSTPVKGIQEFGKNIYKKAFPASELADITEQVSLRRKDITPEKISRIDEMLSRGIRGSTPEIAIDLAGQIGTQNKKIGELLSQASEKVPGKPLYRTKTGSYPLAQKSVVHPGSIASRVENILKEQGGISKEGIEEAKNITKDIFEGIQTNPIQYQKKMRDFMREVGNAYKAEQKGEALTPKQSLSKTIDRAVSEELEGSVAKVFGSESPEFKALLDAKKESSTLQRIGSPIESSLASDVFATGSIPTEAIFSSGATAAINPQLAALNLARRVGPMTRLGTNTASTLGQKLFKQSQSPTRQAILNAVLGSSERGLWKILSRRPYEPTSLQGE